MKTRKLLLSAMIVLLALVSRETTLCQSGPGWEPWGPRAEEIMMLIIKDWREHRAALESGDLDVISRYIDSRAREAFKTNPNVDLITSPGYILDLLISNMSRAPLDADPVRQAIAYIVDRDAIIRDVCDGDGFSFAAIVPPWNPFHNKDASTFSYDPARAKAILDRAGYKVDRKTKLRIDPRTGKTMREMSILTCLPAEAPWWAQMAKIIADDARKIGLPVKCESVDLTVFFDRLNARDFDMHIITGCELGRNPVSLATFLFTPDAPEVSSVMDELRHAPDLASARRAAMKAQAALADEQCMVTLGWSAQYDAFRKDRVTGYVSMPGYGAAGYDNKWTQLNIRRLESNASTVRWLLPSDPKTLNPCIAFTVYDKEPLRWIADKLIEVHPQTLEDVPWLAKEWEVGTWEPQPGATATVVALHLQDGVKWHDGMPFTSEDIEFTIGYLPQVPRYRWCGRDIEKAEIVDEHTINVYFNSAGYWQIYQLNELPILPRHIWEDVKDWQAFEPWNEPHPTVSGLTKLIGTGPFIFKEYKPGEFVRLVRNPDYWRPGPAQ